MREEYPNAGRLRWWWERKKYEAWLNLPCGGRHKTNREFVEDIPKDPYDN